MKLLPSPRSVIISAAMFLVFMNLYNRVSIVGKLAGNPNKPAA